MRAGVADLPAEAHPRRVIESTIAEREGRFEETLAHTEWMVDHLTALGLRAMVAAPMLARAHVLGKLGRFDEAGQAFEEVIALHESLGQTAYLSTALAEYAEILYDGGDLDRAEELARESERLGGPDDVVNFAKGRVVRAQVLADRDDPAAALELAESAVEYAERTDFPNERGRAYEALAYAHRRAGRQDDARAAYEWALELWERYGWTANAERVRALLVEL
jgi:tetratricopeptide (TPR) repeat protein